MPQYASARRYAQAVMQLALEHDTLDAWADDLQTLAELTQDASAAEFLDAPQVSESRKLSAIDEILGASVSRLAANLLALLATKNSARLLPAILERYVEMVDVHRGILWAEVTTASPLSERQRGEVVRLLGGIVGGDVSLRTYVEPALIGGFVARVNDRVIDGSVRAKLRDMRREIVGQLP